MHELLAGFPVVIELPILWGDEDSFDHVNNTVYLKWCETARVEYLTRVGLWQKYYAGKVGPILARISCDFRRALTYPDSVLVGARVAAIGNSSLKMEHRIVSRTMNCVAADADSVLVVLDYNRGRTVPVPEDTRRAIETLEAKSFPAPAEQERSV